MKQPMVLGLSSIAILIAFNVVFSEPPPRVETIKGRIVAYENPLECLNGNAYWSMLIHVQDRSKGAEFVRVRFSLPCSKSPEWLNRKTPTQKFRLMREQDADSVLDEFLACAPDSYEKCQPIPIWRFVPGAEGEKLPFGRPVPSYRSVDLPLAPVV